MCGVKSELHFRNAGRNILFFFEHDEQTRSTVTFYLSPYIFSSASYPKFLNQMRKVLAASYFFFLLSNQPNSKSGCGIETNKIHFLFFILCLIIIIIVTNGTGMKKKICENKVTNFRKHNNETKYIILYDFSESKND